MRTSIFSHTWIVWYPGRASGLWELRDEFLPIGQIYKDIDEMIGATSAPHCHNISIHSPNYTINYVKGITKKWSLWKWNELLICRVFVISHISEAYQQSELLWVLNVHLVGQKWQWWWVDIPMSCENYILDPMEATHIIHAPELSGLYQVFAET